MKILCQNTVHLGDMLEAKLNQQKAIIFCQFYLVNSIVCPIKEAKKQQ
jgi:hypothetical protein